MALSSWARVGRGLSSEMERPHLAGVLRLSSAGVRPFRPRVAGGVFGISFGPQGTKHRYPQGLTAGALWRCRWDSITVLTRWTLPEFKRGHKRDLSVVASKNFM